MSTGNNSDTANGEYKDECKDECKDINGYDNGSDNGYVTVDHDLFSREFIESLQPNVKKVDSDGDVDLFCYTTCDNNDPTCIKSCRGIVFNKDELVLKAYSYNPYYTSDDFAFLDKTYPDLSNCLFFDSYEGTLIRVFFINGKWYISTHRRLDAFKSKWASRVSYGECLSRSLEHEYATSVPFKNRIDQSPLENTASVLDKFISTLDINHQYMFLIQNNGDNRIVCAAPEYPQTFHVGTFSRNKESVDLSIDVNLPYPQRRVFDTMDDVMEYVENTDPTKIQGLIMFTPTEQIKIFNRTYKYYYDLRGNEASIKYRYLQLRMDREKLADFQSIYPNYQRYFDLYENVIYDIVVNIFNAYVKRFIHKEHIAMPSEEYSIMRECHSWHISDRARNHISINKVMNVFNKQSASKINRMIRRHNNAQRQMEKTLEDEVCAKLSTKT